MTEQDKIVLLQDNHRLRAENDTLRRERDEARREVCRLMSMFNAENSVEIAASRSWDCFKNHIGNLTDMVNKETP